MLIINVNIPTPCQKKERFEDFMKLRGLLKRDDGRKRTEEGKIFKTKQSVRRGRYGRGVSSAILPPYLSSTIQCRPIFGPFKAVNRDIQTIGKDS
jgi:hypothetical protein